MKISLRWLLIGLTLLVSLWPLTVFGEAPEWQQRQTKHFLILYNYGHDQEAEYFAAFVDDLYNEVASTFNTQLDTPLTLRLFSDLESYAKANPLAAAIPGVIAHAQTGRKQEIALALPRIRRLPPQIVTNAVRHEVTHLFAAKLSDNHLPTGFQEGIAQYVEKPVQTEMQAAVSLIRAALAQKRLMSWTDLNAPGIAYTDPQVAYPESLSVVSFLVDRYGFPKFLDFLQAMTDAPGFRTALENTYSSSADTLEQEWNTWLPDYLAGRWRINALYAYDLTPAQSLLNSGAYAAAQQELAQAIPLLQSTLQSEKLQEAQQLLTQAEQGIAAGKLASAARGSLERGDYFSARSLVIQARNAYSNLPNTDRLPELDAYERHALAGATALLELDQANQLIQSFKYPEAQQKLQNAITTFQELGNTEAAATGQSMLADMQRKLRTAGLALIGFGSLIFLGNLWRRLLDHRLALQTGTGELI
ncbi:MAG: hypothetical protein HY326_08815 [Chloroflexi bacterium]|nr:hypothetical protein [Chloroflexota bacterium]